MLEPLDTEQRLNLAVGQITREWAAIEQDLMRHIMHLQQINYMRHSGIGQGTRPDPRGLLVRRHRFISAVDRKIRVQLRFLRRLVKQFIVSEQHRDCDKLIDALNDSYLARNDVAHARSAINDPNPFEQDPNVMLDSQEWRQRAGEERDAMADELTMQWLRRNWTILCGTRERKLSEIERASKDATRLRRELRSLINSIPVHGPPVEVLKPPKRRLSRPRLTR